MRQEIVDRIKQNLEAKFSQIPVLFGFPGITVSEIPSLWVVEQGEESELSSSGAYLRRLEVSVEYFDGLRENTAQTLALARQVLDDIREAVEVIRFYRFNIKKMTEVENDIKILPDNKLNVGVLYLFEYVEPFKGSWKQRNETY